MVAVRRVTAVLGLVLTAAALLGGAAMPAPSAPLATEVGAVAGDVDDFTFESMSADYTLSRAEDGTSRLLVVETFVALFPDADQNRGMRRSIPDHYNGQPLRPELVSITDGDGNRRPAETDSDDGTFSMTSRAGGYLRGAQTFVFTYTLEHVTWTFADTGDDEFYWDVNGVDWAQPFGRVSATVTLAPDLVDTLTDRAGCYRGAQGSTDTCEIALQPDAAGGPIAEASASDLAPYQTMTIALGFDQGTFVPYDTSYFSSGWGWLQALGGLGVLGAVAWAFAVRRTALADGRGRATIIAEYTPPANVDALESAVLLGLPTKAIPAEVLEQAVVGSIRILEGKKRWWGGTRLQAQLVDPSLADGDGRMLLDGLFGDRLTPGETFEFGRTDTRFSKSAQAILKAAEAELARRGLRRAVPASVRARPVVATVGFGVVAAIAGFFALKDDIAPYVVVPILVLSFAALFIVSALVARKPLTDAGAETRDHLQGLKVFIEWAEADRIRMLQSVRGAEREPVDVQDQRQVLKLYERLLPYAVVFGQEKEWAEHLVVLYGSAAPVWYVGSGGFDASAFSAGIGTLSASATSSSSTSGGSGGGGSAGGGGGGGGGGGV